MPNRPDTKQLTLKGRQYQFRRKVSRTLADKLGLQSQWVIRNLGTDSLSEAQRKRNRINVELDDLQHTNSDREKYRDASPEEREVLETIFSDKADDLWNAGKRKEAIDYFKEATDQYVPLEQYLQAWHWEAPVILATERLREAALSRFKRWAKIKFVHEVSSKMAGEYVTHLVVDEELSPKSVNMAINFLGSYWKFMLKKDAVQANPWEGQTVSQKPRTKREAWTQAEVERLLEGSEDWLRDAIRVAALSGLRSGELSQLRVRDCVDGLCRVTSGKTESAKRTFPWHSQLSEVISRRTSGQPGDYLFPEIGGVVKKLPKHFIELRNRVFPELRSDGRQSALTLHSLRHYFITSRVNAGCPEHLVKQVVGHKQKGITLGVYYSGASIEQLRDVVEAVRF